MASGEAELQVEKDSKGWAGTIWLIAGAILLGGGLLAGTIYMLVSMFLFVI